MAQLPTSLPALVAEFGPHPQRAPAGGWEGQGEPDRMVPTHCCFCGQQCGIQLKVKDERVIGFEPWEEFPFNKGKLCPKGVKRYMQNEHPDRLRTPLARDDARGFAAVDWNAALDRTAGEIAEQFPIAFASVSHHLGVLKAADLVATEREGQFIRYRLNTTVFQEVARYFMTRFGAEGGKDA